MKSEVLTAHTIIGEKNMKEQLLDKIRNREYTVGIVGLGYVGLPLLWTFLNKGFNIVGIDVDESKLEAIRDGRSYIKHIGAKVMSGIAQSDRCTVSSDFSELEKADAVIMCVPTPLDEYRQPDMSYVELTSKAIAPHLKKGHLLVLESTTWPGTTLELIKPICEEMSGLKAGEDFFLAYSPEREDPGNPNFETATIPKVIGGDGETALEVADALYSAVIVNTVKVSDTKTAEAVKLLENIFRSVNIALVNELKIVFHKMGIDVHEVIDAAKTKPFGFMPFYPGPGLGGHCIPIDPFYLTWKAREFGVNTKFIELAGEINTSMPDFVIHRTMEAMNSAQKSIAGSRILCVGIAYKPDVDDMRESPSFAVMDKLIGYGAEVDFYDPFIPVVPPTHEHSEWTGRRSIDWTPEKLSKYDAAVIVTNHKGVRYGELLECVPVIVDTRNAMSQFDSERIHKA